MSVYRRNVDQIQAIIYSSELIDVDAILPVAEQYSQLCNQVNQRIVMVGRLLDQGLLSEAVHESEIEPKLLDVVTTLDFPERPQWLELNRSLDLPAPPALAIDTVSELNEAYIKVRSMGRLLNKHRLLALARAPVAARMRVLRQIAAFDPKGPVWRKDLGELEAAHFVEMRSQFQTRHQRADLDGMLKLRQELNETQWVVKPPYELTEFIEEKSRELIGLKSRERMHELAEQMRAAMDDLDLDLAKQLLSDWQQLAAHVELDPGSPAMQSAAPVITWIEEQDTDQALREEEEFRQHENRELLDEFEDDLDSGESPDVLTETYESLKAHGVEVPANLRRQYKTALALAQRRRRTKLIGISAAGALAIAAGAGFLVWIFMMR